MYVRVLAGSGFYIKLTKKGDNYALVGSIGQHEIGVSP